MLLKKYLLYYTNMYRTTIIYKLFSAKINKSFISYTTDMKRAMCNLKCYKNTGRVHRSKSADIIAQDDAECIVLQRYENAPNRNFILGELNKFKALEDQDVLVNKLIFLKSKEVRLKENREKYHETNAQLKYYYANKFKINRANVLKKMKKSGVMPKKETLQKYNITQEEIDECIPKKESVPVSTLP